MSIRVLICDDDPIVREAIAAYLRPAEDVLLVGVHAGAVEALAAAPTERPDVALVDLVMPVMDGIEATRRLRAAVPGLAVVVLTALDVEDQVREALEAGADGFILKASSAEAILGAVRAAAAGAGAVIAPHLALSLAQAAEPETAEVPPAPPVAGALGLTARESDVLGLVCAARSNAAIADRLVVSESTVKKHVGSLMAKLRCDSRVELTLRAFELGLATPPSPRPGGTPDPSAATDGT